MYVNSKPNFSYLGGQIRASKPFFHIQYDRKKNKPQFIQNIQYGFYTWKAKGGEINQGVSKTTVI